ncbi:MAG: S8 family serine peptidase [Nitrosopumilaceae archaeon]
MNLYTIIFFSLVLVSCIFVLSSIETEQKAEVYLEKSTSLIGAEIPRDLGYEGDGITIGVIDTGIDYNHPDLFGFGPNGKVVGGYDYVDNDEKPLDTNGHGTEVAGVIAADGNIKGIAPKAKLVAYRVSSTGESVSSDFIVKAIHRAIEDDVNIINISLGINKTNGEIDKAVSEAVKNGIVVVVAAGNNGPGINTIGSPARSIGAITVGASYNNITASLVSTLEVNEKQYQVISMLRTSALPELITTKIVFGGYGRVHELVDLDVKDSILLVERGSDVKGEIIYFAEKEYNAARSGAKALIVYNNEPGIFFGELAYPNGTVSYTPTIPAISISRDEGLALKESLQKETIAKLNVFYHPDLVAHFSSRGPVSQFYIKPDLVAPGVFVNSTLINGKYNLTSGTSFAAPHVSGAAAILLQKNPDLTPPEITSLLSTTSDSVTDPYGSVFPVEVAGSGRINLAKAFSADLIILPHNLVFNLSLEKSSQTKSLHLKNMQETIPQLEIEFSSKENGIVFEHFIENDSLNVKTSVMEEKIGDFEEVLTINGGKTSYHIPILVHITKGQINAIEKNGVLSFDLYYPESWSYAKISLTNKDTGISRTTSITPQKNSSLAVYDGGEHWIEAQITTQNGTDSAYATIIIQNPSEKTGFEFLELFGITLKHILIISGILVTAIIVGLKARRI